MKFRGYWPNQILGYNHVLHITLCHGSKEPPSPVAEHFDTSESIHFSIKDAVRSVFQRWTDWD